MQTLTSDFNAYTFGTVPLFYSFWLAVHHSLSEVFSTVIDPHPLIALFGVRPGDCDWSLNMYKVVAFTTLLALRQILEELQAAIPCRMDQGHHFSP